MPSQKYTMAAEIFGHAQRIGRHFGLYENALFSTSVTGLRWDEAASRWIVTTDRGDRIRARFVAMGTGPLHRPKLPGIPGIEKFRGHAFHTSRWDYAYTGGSYEGAPMDKLARQARRHHRHRRDRGAVHPAALARRRAALRLPAHAVVRRHPQQPRDRPRLVRDARAGLAAQVAAELRDAPDRRLRATRTSSRTAGRTSRSASATASCRRWASRARRSTPRPCGRRTRTATTTR